MPQPKSEGFYYRKQFYYESAFKSEMDSFLKFLQTDPVFDKLDLTRNNQRFSVAIRMLIATYNQKRRKAIKQKNETNKVNNTEEISPPNEEQTL